MDQGSGTEGNAVDLDLLARIEETRSGLLSDPSVRERISQRAYERYQSRGGEPGRDVEDWVQAENEVLSVLIEQEMGRLTREAAAQGSQGVGRKKGNGTTRKLGARKAVAPKEASSSSKSSSTGVSKRPSTETITPEKKAKKKRESRSEGEALNAASPES